MSKKRGSYHKNNSINTLQTPKTGDYLIFTDLYNYLHEYKKQVQGVEKVKIM